MTPYLQIAFQRGCAFFKIGSFKNRVCPMLLTHAEHGCLKPFLTLQCVIIGKKVELENAGAVVILVQPKNILLQAELSTVVIGSEDGGVSRDVHPSNIDW